MKNKLVILFCSLTFNTFGQDELTKVLDSACNCLSAAANTVEENTKFDFEYKFNTCLDSLFHRAIAIDSSYQNNLKKNELIHRELKSNYADFNKIDSLHQFYSTLTFESIASADDCKLLHSGTFVTYGDPDSTLIIMNKKEQMVVFKSGTYTKSKIEWIDECSYRLIRIESTDSYEKQVAPGDVRIVKIIHVSHDGTIFYEILVNGRSYSGRLIKIAY